MTSITPRLLAFVACSLFAGSNCAAANAISIEIPSRTNPVDFGTEIAPLLRANCVACHHEKKASGGLVLETPQSILKGGDLGPAVIAGKSGDSLLLKAAAHQVDSIMPPPENTVGAKPLTPAQLGLIKLWIDQGATGALPASQSIRWQSLPGGYQPAMASAVTADGQFAVTSRGNRLIVIHLPSARQITRLIDPTLVDPTLNSTPNDGRADAAHRDLVRCLAFDPTGNVLASGSYQEVKLWGRPRVSRAAEWIHDAEVRTMAVSSDARWAATGDERGRIHLWDISTGKEIRVFPAHQAAVTGVAFSPDASTLFSSGLDKSLRAWNVGDGQPIGKGMITSAPITAMILINQGATLVTGGQDGIARIWDAKAVRESTGELAKPRQEIKAHGAAITVLAPLTVKVDEFLSGGQDGLVRRWQIETGKQLNEFKNDGPVVALAVSSDGQRIASAGTASAMLWSGDGKTIAQLNVDPRLALNLAKMDAEITFTKTAISLAQQDLKNYEGLIRIAGVRKEDVKKAEEELVKVQKVRDEKKAALEKVQAEKDKVEAAQKALADSETAVTVAMTVIDRAKAISERTSKELADAEQAVRVREELLKQQEAAKVTASSAAKAAILVIRSLGFTADGRRLALGCETGVVHVFDAEVGSSTESHADHQGAVHSICSTSAGQLITGSADRRALIWNAPVEWRLERVIGGASPADGLVDRVLTVDFSRDGQWLATGGGIPSRSGELKIWNVADGRLIRQFPDAHTETVFAVRFSPDGKQLASAAGDRFIKIFETQTGAMKHRIAGHTGQVLTLGWKADGKMLISGGSDNVLKLWDTETGLPLRTMKGTTYRIGAYKREVTSVAFIGESEQILAACGDGTVRLHRTTSESDILTYAGSKGYQFSVAVTPDGRSVLATGSDGTLRIWTGHEQQPKQSFAP
ncbi:MAG: Planctomycete cytochrome [Planctomycetaceae bacterium]|nr:Planctomycete cytochrome [Planctomycetaceae bacterium]